MAGAVQVWIRALMRRTDVASMKDESHYLWLLCLLLLLAGPPCSWINDPEQRSTPHYLPPPSDPSIYLHALLECIHAALHTYKFYIFRRRDCWEGRICYFLALCAQSAAAACNEASQHLSSQRREMIKLMNEKYYFNARKGWKRDALFGWLRVLYCSSSWFFKFVRRARTQILFLWARRSIGFRYYTTDVYSI